MGYKWEKFSIDFLQDCVKQSKNTTELSLKLGYKNRNSKAIQALFEKYNFDISHFTSQQTIIGKKFGSLTVLSKTEDKYARNIIYKCQCECGQICYKRGGSLTSGHITHCSANCSILKQSHINSKKIQGEKFGLLTPIKQIENGVDRNARWLCQCDCGNTTIRYTRHLLNGQAVSCGCLNHSIKVEEIRKILDAYNIKYKMEYIFPDLLGDKSPLRFDFVIFNDNNEIQKIIEYQGEQHYRVIKSWGGEEKFIQRQRYDQLKREYCKEKSYFLQEIKYSEKITDNLVLKGIFINE